MFDLDGLTPSSLAYWWTATAFDTSGNKATRSTSDFKVVAGDVVAPSQVIGAPGSYAVVSSPVTLSGTADDDVAVG